jgi:hypothetical protein
MQSGEFVDGVITSAGMEESKEKGTPSIWFMVGITGEDGAPIKSKCSLWLTDKALTKGKDAGKTMAEAKLGHLHEQFGFAGPLTPEGISDFFVGKEVRAQMKHEEYNGKWRWLVDGIYSKTLKGATIRPETLAKLDNIMLQFQSPARVTKAAAASTPAAGPKKSFFKKD